MTIAVTPEMTDEHHWIVYTIMGISFIVILAFIIFRLNKCFAKCIKTPRINSIITTENPILYRNQQSTSHPLQNITAIMVNNDDQAVAVPIQNNQNKLHEYAFEDFLLIRGEQISDGSFGPAYRGTLKKGAIEKTVAIKLINTSETQVIITDISTVLKLEHPNIVKIHGCKIDPRNSNIHIIITEYVAKGSILKYLETFNIQDNSNFKHFLEVTKDIAKGLEYLFSQDIVHRDLAARNILVTEDNHAKISFFGLARLCNVNGVYQCMRSYAPEVIGENYTFTKMSDIWSFGVTMYEIFYYGKAPYQDVKSFKDLIKLIKTRPLEKPYKCPDEIYEKLMLPCWKIDPEERPEINQILITIDELLTENPIYHRNQQSTSHPSQNIAAIMVNNDDQAVTVPIQNNQNKLYEYAFEDFLLIRGEQISEGSFGPAYRGTLKKGGVEKTVAIKLINTTETQKGISTMLKLEHPNVVKMHGYKIDPENFNIHIIIMEYVAKGSILKYLKTFNIRDNSNFKHFLELTKDIAKGLEYLFSQDIVHRDLVARNILVTEDNHAKIGLARHSNDHGVYPIKWCSPEVIDKKIYTKMSDIWSFGVTMYEIFSYGKAPYQHVKSLEDFLELIDLIKTRPLQKPNECPDEIYEKLMLPCWKIDPEERPAINQILITIDELLASFEIS
uniref:CSON003569 protein n=1 Tax=Culicoides sonorensis TaxID=179676 RepID=A0A336MLS6_CULSO